MNDPVNDSEKFVYDICTKSFLSMWSYINPQGKTQEKELCDILIVCDPHIIVVSVKDIHLKNTDNPKLDFDRWQRKAVDESKKQIKGAIRSLENSKHVIRKDGTIGLDLPLLEKRIYHRVAVAFGGRREVSISSGFEEDAFYHVFDEQSVSLLIEHLNTISDFVNYLRDKEKCLLKTTIINSGGEENLLAWYLYNDRQFPKDTDMMLLEDNLWTEFNKKPEFKAKLQSDIKSYIWDELIEVLCQGEIIGNNYIRSDFTNFELAVRGLAQEDRFSRRMLGEAFKDFLELCKLKKICSRFAKSINGIGYVFFAYNRNSTFEERKSILHHRCLALICSFPECLKIVGVGLNVPGEKQKDGYTSELVLLQTSNNQWSEEEIQNSKTIRDKFDYFKNAKEIHIHENEYPNNPEKEMSVKPVYIPFKAKGFAHPKCYLSETKGCSQKISGEHYISENLLNKIERKNKTIDICGISWMPKEHLKSIGKSSLTANILCTQHNSDLSGLDSEIGKLFEAIWTIDQAFKDDVSSDCIFSINGSDIERWILKTIVGMVESQQIKQKSGNSFQYKKKCLNLICSHDYQWPLGWGLYIGTPKDTIYHSSSFELIPMYNLSNGDLLALAMKFNGFRMNFLLGKPSAGHDFGIHRPRSVYYKKGSIKDEIRFLWNGKKEGQDMTFSHIGKYNGYPPGYDLPRAD